MGNFIDKLQQKFTPQRYAERKVGEYLKEYESRPRLGDAKMHEKLDELNQARDAFNRDELVAAYREGQKETYCGAEKSKMRDCVSAHQTGMARELAEFSMADGTLDAAEKTAIQDIANQQWTQYGNCGSQPHLAYGESMGLRAFAEAPNDSVREWILKESSEKTIPVEGAERLGEILFRDGTLDEAGRKFVVGQGGFFKSSLSKGAEFFLRALDGTDPNLRPQYDKGTGPSLAQQAFSIDHPYKYDEITGEEIPNLLPDDVKGPTQLGLERGVQFAKEHGLKGMKDSSEARSLFPKK